MKSFICWISPKTKENWEICKENNMWGIGKNSNVANDHCRKISKGDKLYIWVGDFGSLQCSTIPYLQVLKWLLWAYDPNISLVYD